MSCQTPVANLTALWEKLIKIGAKVTRHSTYVIFQLAEVAVPRELFATILERIAVGNGCRHSRICGHMRNSGTIRLSFL